MGDRDWEPALRRAWLLTSDDDFAYALLRAFRQPDPPDAVERALRLGATRTDVTRAILRRPEVVEAFGTLEPELSDFRTEREVARALGDLRGVPDADFVAGAYRAILGEEPEPGVIGLTVERMEHGRSRARVVRDLACSAEAAARGFDEQIAHRLAGGVFPRARRPA